MKGRKKRKRKRKRRDENTKASEIGLDLLWRFWWSQAKPAAPKSRRRQNVRRRDAGSEPSGQAHSKGRQRERPCDDSQSQDAGSVVAPQPQGASLAAALVGQGIKLRARSVSPATEQPGQRRTAKGGQTDRDRDSERERETSRSAFQGRDRERGSRRGCG